jgi:hypothetical protein
MGGFRSKLCSTVNDSPELHRPRPGLEPIVKNDVEHLRNGRLFLTARVGPQGTRLAEEPHRHQRVTPTLVLEQQLDANLKPLEIRCEPQVGKKVVERVVDERRGLQPKRAPVDERLPPAPLQPRQLPRLGQGPERHIGRTCHGAWQ